MTVFAVGLLAIMQLWWSSPSRSVDLPAGAEVMIKAQCGSNAGSSSNACHLRPLFKETTCRGGWQAARLRVRRAAIRHGTYAVGRRSSSLCVDQGCQEKRR